MAEIPSRTRPNILITGTPGAGKTTLAEQIADALGMTHLHINKIAEERGCYDGRDEDLGCWIVDEDRLLDAIESDVLPGNVLIDWHACDLFPESWIDLVLVVRCSTELLYDRLVERKYSPAKLEENMDAEIMQVLLDEAREAFAEEIVVELKGDSLDDLDENVERVERWVEAWVAGNEEGRSVVGLETVEEGESEEMEK